ncbi:uncharacterized protein MONBRDRAFT_35481 [Monosiga brevicollis MX1]|uniref:Uncharacterized protein n=1 Tax=Monosiga brevicollis TaxID=81824 RepID=A9UPD3_MONBE|nr:uncharacterized protein MONBRDRAFT_35481 [Monosiga brevicollis MX1]EDQ92398.1 predicted protein [Monosiga brevicollis MX1]|eukprot:XP_001742160.1 hypothetical protein [Monosiga brevicollis MX1]
MLAGRSILAVLLAAQCAMAVVKTLREPMDEYAAALQATHRECTAIYQVDFEARYTTQGNDLGMLPAQGVDTTVVSTDPEYANFADIMASNPDDYPAGEAIGANLIGEPKKNDVVAQAYAASQYSVTALTEVNTATPIGYQRDMIHIYHSVCVNFTNVGKRWVEIMAQSLQSDQQICVADWNRPNLAENPIQVACGNGELFVCRDSANSINADGSYADEMGIKFFCQDSCDDPYFEFYWRVVASQIRPYRNSNGRWEQGDGENWCGMRGGDDYPQSLLQPYPENYDAPAVFQKSVSGASSVFVSTLLAASLALIAAALY